MMQSLANPEFGYYEPTMTDIAKGFAMPQLLQNASYVSHPKAIHADPVYEEPSSFFSSFLSADFPIDVSFPVQTVPEAVPMMKAAGYSSARVQAQAPIMQVAQNQTPATTTLEPVTKSKGTKRKAAKAVDQPVADKPHKPDVDAKRQKRRVKNREAAQLFRQRQKQHIRDLEQEVASINNKNVQLSTQMEVMRAENAMVKDQLQFLRGYVLEGLRSAFPDAKFREMEALLDQPQAP